MKHASFESFWYEKHSIYSIRCYAYKLSEPVQTHGWRKSPESISYIVVREVTEKGEKWTDLHWADANLMLIQTPCQHLYFSGPALRQDDVHDHKGIVAEFGYEVRGEPVISVQEG